MVKSLESRVEGSMIDRIPKEYSEAQQDYIEDIRGLAISVKAYLIIL